MTNRLHQRIVTNMTPLLRLQIQTPSVMIMSFPPLPIGEASSSGRCLPADGDDALNFEFYRWECPAVHWSSRWQRAVGAALEWWSRVPRHCTSQPPSRCTTPPPRSNRSKSMLRVLLLLLLLSSTKLLLLLTKTYVITKSVFYTKHHWYNSTNSTYSHLRGYNGQHN